MTPGLEGERNRSEEHAVVITKDRAEIVAILRRSESDRFDLVEIGIPTSIGCSVYL